MKKIKLTQNKYAVVDDEDYAYLTQWKWYVAHGYACRTDNRSGNKQIRMHRVIAMTPAGMDTDHINGDRLDNRRSNLRVATRSQNVANSFVEKQNKSGYKGVSWKKANRKWCAQIRCKNKVYHIGLFSDKEEAAAAYNVVAQRCFGKFAVLNMIEGGEDGTSTGE